jgi:hypothetical protein
MNVILGNTVLNLAPNHLARRCSRAAIGLVEVSRRRGAVNKSSGSQPSIVRGSRAPCRRAGASASAAAESPSDGQRAAAGDQYRIGPRDVLSIRVAAPDIVPQFSAESLEVNECGMIPLLSVQNEERNEVRAAGPDDERASGAVAQVLHEVQAQPAGRRQSEASTTRSPSPSTARWCGPDSSNSAAPSACSNSCSSTRAARPSVRAVASRSRACPRSGCARRKPGGSRGHVRHQTARGGHAH